MYAAFYESYVVRGSYRTDGQVRLHYTQHMHNLRTGLFPDVLYTLHHSVC